MFKRIAPACIAAAVLMLANGCCCPQTQLCGDIAGCDSCGVSGCGLCGIGSGCVAGCVKNAMTCGSGCGEVYWDEWVNDPPPPCDPCDNYGNWTGDAFCAPSCNPFSGIRHLWGYRYAPAGCDVAYESYVETMPNVLPMEEEAEEDLVRPKPAAEPTPAKEASAGRRVRHATYDRPTTK